MNDDPALPGPPPEDEEPVETQDEMADVEPAIEAAAGPPDEPAGETPPGPSDEPAVSPPPPPPVYRPPAAPLSSAPVAPPPAPPMAAAPRPGPGGSSGGETSFTVEYPERSSRLWALLYLLLGIKVIVLIAHALIFIVLAIGALVVFIIAQLVVLFTGHMPEGMHRFQMRVLAQSNKMRAWVNGLTDGLPPFMLSDDPYPVETSVGHPARSSRLWALLNPPGKYLALLPHFITLFVLRIASDWVVLVAQIAILVTGRFPRGMFDFVVGVMRWETRVAAFFFGLRDEYPPFSLQ